MAPSGSSRKTVGVRLMPNSRTRSVDLHVVHVVTLGGEARQQPAGGHARRAHLRRELHEGCGGTQRCAELGGAQGGFVEGGLTGPAVGELAVAAEGEHHGHRADCYP